MWTVDIFWHSEVKPSTYAFVDEDSRLRFLSDLFNPALQVGVSEIREVRLGESTSAGQGVLEMKEAA